MLRCWSRKHKEKEHRTLNSKLKNEDVFVKPFWHKTFGKS